MAHKPLVSEKNDPIDIVSNIKILCDEYTNKLREQIDNTSVSQLKNHNMDTDAAEETLSKMQKKYKFPHH